jgi:hypothetical protein
MSKRSSKTSGENQKIRQRQVDDTDSNGAIRSPFTLGFVKMLRTHKYEDKVRETINILNKNMYPTTMKILSKITAGHDTKFWLQIEETSPNQMRKHAIYLSIITRDGEIVGVYVGSATADNDGVAGRFGDYENVKLKGYLTNEEAKSEYLKMALYPANDWHVRPHLLMHPSETLMPGTACLEGLFTTWVACYIENHHRFALAIKLSLMLTWKFTGTHS